MAKIAWIVYDFDADNIKIVFDVPYNYYNNAQYSVTKIVYFEVEE